MGKGEQQEFFIPLHGDFFFSAFLNTLTQKVHASGEFAEETAFFFRYRNGKIAPCKLLGDIAQPAERHDDMPPDIIQKTDHQHKQRTQYTVDCRKAGLSVSDNILHTIQRFAHKVHGL